MQISEWAAVAILLIAISSVVGARLLLHIRARDSYAHSIFLIAIPQYVRDAAEKRERKDFKLRLAEIENLFAVIASTRAQRGLRAFFYGRSDHFSLEIVSKEGMINFYAAIPKKLADLFKQQIHTVYPYAHIEEVDDYNIFKPHSFIEPRYLTLKKNSSFPIKTYASFEIDPLEGLATALSKIPVHGGAAIQFVLRSARRSWHAASRKLVHEIHQGKSLQEVGTLSLRGGHGPLGIISKVLSFIFSIFGSSLQTKKKNDNESAIPKPRELSTREQDALKGIEDKNSKAAFDVNIRIVVAAENQQHAELHTRTILDAFGQFNIYEFGNAFKAVVPSRKGRAIRAYIFRNFEARYQCLLNSEEFVSLFHLPEDLKTPNIGWLKARRLAPPLNMPPDGTLLGKNIYRDETVEVRIKDDDRRRHLYVIGQTGTGKSTLLENLALQDIERGKGVCIIDPHGDLVESVLSNIPTERFDDVIYFNPADVDRPMGLNMMEFDQPEQKTFVINEMIKIFDKLYDLRQTGGPMFEQYMRNTMLLMMDDPDSGSTLLEISKVLSDEKFRKFKLSKSKNPVVRDFWEKEAQKAGGEAALANMVPYITSKLNQFIANDVMRPIISQQHSSFNFRAIMDSHKILLISLSKGKIGELNSALLGMVIVGKLLMAALSRVDMAEEERKDFYLYIDEFQNYTTDSIAIILSEARKYRLVLSIAHQYIGQLVKGNDTAIKDAVFGNVGTIAAYRVGVEDAELVAQQFTPVVSEYDVMNIEKFNFYLRMLIDNHNPAPFNCRSNDKKRGDPNRASMLREMSRLRYGRPRDEVEREILSRSTVASRVATHLPPLA